MLTAPDATEPSLSAEDVRVKQHVLNECQWGLLCPRLISLLSPLISVNDAVTIVVVLDDVCQRSGDVPAGWRRAVEKQQKGEHVYDECIDFSVPVMTYH